MWVAVGAAAAARDVGAIVSGGVAVSIRRRGQRCRERYRRRGRSGRGSVIVIVAGGVAVTVGVVGVVVVVRRRPDTVGVLKARGVAVAVVAIGGGRQDRA